MTLPDRSVPAAVSPVALPREVADRAKRLVEAGTAANTRRAYQGDLRCFWTWARITLGLRETRYPVAVEVVVQFITDHLAGLSPRLDQALVTSGAKARLGPQRIATVRRRIASLSVVHAARGVENPCRDSRVRQLLGKAARAAVAEGQRPRQKRAATRDVLDAMLATCGESLIDVRDRAVLLVGAASGGRRRSELTAMTFEDLTPVPGGFLIRLGRTKTDQEGRGLHVPVMGRAAAALQAWLDAAAITHGPLFLGVAKGGRLAGRLSDRSVARIVQKRAEQAGFDASAFGGHSLRAGFITESGRQRVPLGEAKALSGHRSDAMVMNREIDEIWRAVPDGTPDRDSSVERVTAGQSRHHRSASFVGIDRHHSMCAPYRVRCRCPRENTWGSRRSSLLRTDRARSAVALPDRTAWRSPGGRR